jgi:hypothetical protein
MPTLRLIALGRTLTACETGSGTMDADAPLRLAHDAQDQSASGRIFVADPGPDFRWTRPRMPCDFQLFEAAFREREGRRQ